MKKIFVFSALIFSTVFGSEVFAQRQTIEVLPEKGARPSGYNLPDFTAPAEKPADNSRGTCCLNFDNWTGYYLDVWVDDVYRGRVAPWDYDGLCVLPGPTTWYVQSADGRYWWRNNIPGCSSTWKITIK